MSAEKINNQTLEDIIQWCHGVAHGNYTDRTLVTNDAWNYKYLALQELKTLRAKVSALAEQTKAEATQ